MADENTEQEDKPAGWQQIDYDRLPEAEAKVVEARVNRLYGQVKQSERLQQQLAKDNKALFDRLKALEDTTVSRKTDQIKQELKEAAEEGDSERIATLTADLVEATSRPAAEPASSDFPDADEPAGNGQTDLSEHLSAQEEAIVAAWYAQTDEAGQPIRPWVDQNHPSFNAAATAFMAAWNRPDVKEQGINAVLAEVDRIMGVQKPDQPAQQRQNAAAPVMANQGPRAPSKGTPKLTAEQREAAALMGIKEEVYLRELANIDANVKSGRKASRRVFED